MKVLVVFGTRPEAIKMCPLVLELQKHEKIECKVCVTGQHREMMQSVLEIFHVAADYNLDIMQPNQTLAMITASIVEKLDKILEYEQPKLVLVHGDTSSSFAAAITAFYRQIPIGHVEAGLRTYNMYAPFPEEFNRQAVDLITEFYFVPTDLTKKQLLREGKDEAKIYVTGNTVIDALQTTVYSQYYNENLAWADGSRLILLTSHRRENIGQPMENIFKAVQRIAVEYKNVKVIYPMHKSPKVREIANRILQGVPNVRLIEPLNVLDFHNFMSKSYMILTDSGGIQEEAPSLGKPVLVLRSETERPEGIKAGTLKLAGTEEETVYLEIKRLLDNKTEYERMSKAVNPYGDGKASKRIADIIWEHFKEE